MLDDKKVKDKLKEIYIRLFNIDLDKLTIEESKYNLLGRDFALTEVDLLCLYMAIEKELGIFIPQECIVEGKFNSIYNIENIIFKEVNVKQNSKVG